MLCIEPVGNRKWRVFVSAETGEGETFDFRGYRSAWCTGVKYYKFLAGYSDARDLTYAILQLNQQSTLQNISTIFSKSSSSSFCISFETLLFFFLHLAYLLQEKLLHTFIACNIGCLFSQIAFGVHIGPQQHQKRSHIRVSFS